MKGSNALKSRNHRLPAVSGQRIRPSDPIPVPLKPQLPPLQQHQQPYTNTGKGQGMPSITDYSMPFRSSGTHIAALLPSEKQPPHPPLPTLKQLWRQPRSRPLPSDWRRWRQRRPSAPSGPARAAPAGCRPGAPPRGRFRSPTAAASAGAARPGGAAVQAAASAVPQRLHRVRSRRQRGRRDGVGGDLRVPRGEGQRTSFVPLPRRVLLSSCWHQGRQSRLALRLAV